MTHVKSLFVLSLFLSASFVNLANAEESAGSGKVQRTFGLTYNPIEALFGAHTLALAYKANDKMELLTRVGIYNPLWSIKPSFNNQPGTFGEFWLGARFFILGTALDDGVYLSSAFYFVYGVTPGGVAITVPYNAGPDQYILGSEFELGYEHVTDFGLLLNIYAGLQGYVGWNFPDSGTYALNMMHPYAAGRVGYAW